MNIKRLPIGKIIAIIMVLALVAAGVATYLSERQAKLEKAANTTAALKRAFSYDGEIYVYNSASDYYFLRKLGDDENYILLPGYSVGWSDAIGKFVYTEGKKVKTCDINGENSETIYKFSGERMVVLSGYIDKYVLLDSASKTSNGGHIPSGTTYLLNLETREAIETEMITSAVNQPIAISGNYLYFFKRYITEIRTDLYRCDITTGKCELLIEELPDYPANDSGCIIGDYLYFNYETNDLASNHGAIVRYPLSGGELEPVDIGIKASLIAEYKGKLLITSYTWAENTENYTIHVYTYDVDSHKTAEIVSASDITSRADSLRVYDGLLVASAFREAFTVELP